jgi:predicted permease
MSPLFKTVEAILVIVLSLGAGYACRRRRWLEPAQAPAISRTGLTFFTPLVTFLVMWALEPVGWGAVALPLICVLAIFLMWPPAAWIGRRLFSDPQSQAPWVLCSIFSNQGTTYGTFICYIALGTQGAALGTLMVWPYTPLVYLLGFYLAGQYTGQATSPWQAFTRTFRHGYSRNPLVALAVGLVVRLFVPHLPPLAGPAIAILVPLTTAIQLFAIGLTLRFSVISEYLRPVLLMQALKFLVTPLLGLALAAAFGLWGQADNELVKIVLIQCACPVAILALAVAQVMRLNVDLANSLWITSTLLAVATAPLVLWVVRLL